MKGKYGGCKNMSPGGTHPTRGPASYSIDKAGTTVDQTKGSGTAPTRGPSAKTKQGHTGQPSLGQGKRRIESYP